MLLQNPFIESNQQQIQQGSNNQPGSGNQPPNQNQNNPGGSGNLTIPEGTQGTNPGAGNQPTNKTGESDPLTDFSKLWDNEPVDPNNPNPDPSSQSYLPQIDATKLNEMVGKIDFTKNISPEESAAIIAGGEGALPALSSVLNKSVRQAFLMSFQATQKMVESGLGTAKDRFLGEVPDHVSRIVGENDLTSTNPIMRDPAYAKTVKDVREQIQKKYPKATPAEVNSAVTRYFDQMVEKLQKGKTGNAQTTEQNVTQNQQKLKAGDPTADWESWMTGITENK